MNEELKKSLVGMFLDGIFTIGDVIEESYKYGCKETTNKACKWIKEYDANDYLEEVADFGVYTLNEEKVIENFKQFLEENHVTGRNNRKNT